MLKLASAIHLNIATNLKVPRLSNPIYFITSIHKGPTLCQKSQTLQQLELQVST